MFRWLRSGFGCGIPISEWLSDSSRDRDSKSVAHSHMFHYNTVLDSNPKLRLQVWQCVATEKTTFALIGGGSSSSCLNQAILWFVVHLGHEQYSSEGQSTEQLWANPFLNSFYYIQSNCLLFRSSPMINGSEKTVYFLRLVLIPQCRWPFIVAWLAFASVRLRFVFRAASCANEAGGWG